MTYATHLNDSKSSIETQSIKNWWSHHQELVVRDLMESGASYATVRHAWLTPSQCARTCALRPGQAAQLNTISSQSKEFSIIPG